MRRYLNKESAPEELVKAIAVEFGLPVGGLDRLDTLSVINRFLLQQVEDKRETVLLIDEAQDLTEELLEQVRLLSNLETDQHKLLQIVLSGQPELRDLLNRHELRADARAAFQDYIQERQSTRAQNRRRLNGRLQL